MFPEIEKWFSTLNSGFTLQECWIKKKKKNPKNSFHQVVLKLFLLVVYISWFVYFIVECKSFFSTVVVRLKFFAKQSQLWRIRKGNVSWGSVPGKGDQVLARCQGRTWAGDVFNTVKIVGHFVFLCWRFVFASSAISRLLFISVYKEFKCPLLYNPYPSCILTWKS